MEREYIGYWIRRKIEQTKGDPRFGPDGVSISSLVKESGIERPNLAEILDNPAERKQSTIDKIAHALVKLGVVSDVREVQLAAGYVPAGYVAVQTDQDDFQHISVDPEMADLHRNIDLLAPSNREIVRATINQALRQQGIQPPDQD